MIDLPAMWHRSVPTANGIGKPKMLSAGVTIQAPPMPKKPPSTPTATPSRTSSRGLMATPEIGRVIVRKSIAAPYSFTSRLLRSRPIMATSLSMRNPRVTPMTIVSRIASSVNRSRLVL